MFTNLSHRWSLTVKYKQTVFLDVFQQRARGCRLNVIIVAEGAIARGGKPITSDQIKKVSSFFTFIFDFF